MDNFDEFLRELSMSYKELVISVNHSMGNWRIFVSIRNACANPISSERTFSGETLSMALAKAVEWWEWKKQEPK